MMTRCLLALTIAAAALPAGAQPSRDAELHAFLQQRFGNDRATYPETRYVAAWADLNGDRRPEAVVYMISPGYCGTGGCSLFIYTPEQGSWYQHGRLTVTNPPIMMLNSRTNGWRDLAVRVSGGGVRPHTARVPHGRHTYEPNPSTGASRPLRRPAPGRVLIAAGDRGRRLF